MLITIVAILAVVIVVLIMIVAARPSDFRVARSAIVAAGPGAVFAQVNDLHRWEAWSPWAKLDPNVKNTYDGPNTGIGAGFAWSGSNKVGEGRMTIAESRPDELIRLKLDFVKPFKATNIAEFTFQPDGNGTKVTWAMSGKYNFVTKAMGLFMNFDKVIGGQFETGLEQMNATVTKM